MSEAEELEDLRAKVGAYGFTCEGLKARIKELEEKYAASQKENEYLKRVSCTATHIDLEDENKNLRAENERLKNLEDRIGSGWALVNGEELLNENNALREINGKYEEALKGIILAFERSPEDKSHALWCCWNKAKEALAGRESNAGEKKE